MQRIVIAVLLSGLLAGCGQQAPAGGEAGAPVAELDFIEAVPIDEDAPAPVAQPQPAAKKEEPKTEAATEDKAPDAEARSVPPAPEPTADDAASATRRANETTATPDAGATTETPYRPN